MDQTIWCYLAFSTISCRYANFEIKTEKIPAENEYYDTKLMSVQN